MENDVKDADPVTMTTYTVSTVKQSSTVQKSVTILVPIASEQSDVH